MVLMLHISWVDFVSTNEMDVYTIPSLLSLAVVAFLSVNAVFHICRIVRFTGDEKRGENTEGFTIPVNQEQIRDVVIIGAGLSGLAVASGFLHLTSKDQPSLRITIVERRKNFSESGATFGLHVNGLKALRELVRDSSVADDLESNLRAHGLAIPNNTKRGLMMPWYEIRNILLETIGYGWSSSDDNVEFRLNTQVIDIINSREGVHLKLNTGDHLYAYICVVADGCKSSSRKLLNLPNAHEVGVQVFRATLNTCRPDTLVDTSAGKRVQSAMVASNDITPVLLKGDNAHFCAFNFNQKHPGRVCWTLTHKDKSRMEQNYLNARDIDINGVEMSGGSHLDKAQAEDLKEHL
jgi:hypothetical protein